MLRSAHQAKLRKAVRMDAHSLHLEALGVIDGATHKGASMLLDEFHSYISEEQCLRLRDGYSYSGGDFIVGNHPTWRRMTIFEALLLVRLGAIKQARKQDLELHPVTRVWRGCFFLSGRDSILDHYERHPKVLMVLQGTPYQWLMELDCAVNDLRSIAFRSSSVAFRMGQGIETAEDLAEARAEFEAKREKIESLLEQ